MNTEQIVAGKLQHHVFFVKNLADSQRFYMNLFDLNFSADNNPDTSAACRMAGHTMHFYSFGYYHHDICFVLQPSVQVDTDQFMSMTLALRPGMSMASLVERLKQSNVSFREGRLLASQRPSGKQAVHFQDPNGHWLEVIEAD